MGRNRLLFKEAAVTALDGDRLQVQVTLETPGKTFVGLSSSEESKDGQLRLAVEATLDAIAQALKRPIKFYISSIAVKKVDEKQKRFVVVLLKTDYFIKPVGEAIELLGACQISNSEIEAAVRATLNATNRTISLLLR